MFSGIVDHVGIIKEMTETPSGLRLWIHSHFKDFKLGESISVDGCCLTVEDHTQDMFRVALSRETLAKTISGKYQSSQCVNLERALCFSDRVGGHFVTGHVDQTARVKMRETLSEFVRLEFHGICKDSMSYLSSKGSVAVNGVSLTLNALHVDGFDVMLIPHTLERTNLRNLHINGMVNIEFDSMAKIIVAEVRRLMEKK